MSDNPRMPLILITPEDRKQASALIKQFSKANISAQIIEVFVPTTTSSSSGKKTEKLPPVTPKALKEILTKVKEELGSDKLKELFVLHDCKKLPDLPEKEYSTLYVEAEALLKGDEPETDDDDGFFDMLDDDDDDDDDDDLGLDDDDDDDDLGLDDDDDDDGDEMDLDEVKKLASKFSDKRGLDEQRKILEKFGIATTRSLKKATPEQLKKIAAQFTKGLK